MVTTPRGSWWRQSAMKRFADAEHRALSLEAENTQLRQALKIAEAIPA